MKKLFFAALFAIAIASSAFAGPGNVNINILNNFSSTFRDASGITWSASGDFAKATFTNNNVKMNAFYNINGDLIGTSKAISMDELPVGAKRTFAKKFGGYTVTEAIIFEAPEETAYFISANNDSENVIAKVNQHEQVSIYKKTKK